MSVTNRQAKKWRDEDMVSAMAACQGRMNVAASARQFNVPRKTLDDRVKGHIHQGSKQGPPKKLNQADEKVLVRYALYSARQGFPLTKAMLLSYALTVAKKRGTGVSLGQKWWLGFLKRNGDALSMRTPDIIDWGRTSATKQNVVEAYFELLQNTVQENNLIGKPSQVYNCDEMFFQMHRTKLKVLVQKGTKAPYLQVPGTREHITTLVCINAEGGDVPPFIIFPKAFPGGENGVILLCLPPHTSHVLQPLDVGIFGPLKVEFARLALNICHFNNSFVLSKRDFGKVFRKAYKKCVEELHVKKAFKACGIWPLDSHAINSQRVMPAAIVVLPEDTTTTSGPDTVVCEAGPSTLPAGLSAQAAAPPAPPLHPLVASGDIPEDLADLFHPIKRRPHG
ncbi:hypothetical protein SKAU_G00212230 [Synaphobranchus kaupii]|uniref:HTH CENPB-type domain-containing protein n=1 Tax=Synaphobranchus kaupii TaxID=118154 RepID=A0A9Q1IV16_SYNKA|nr:hypothetical protein SKAU_G00212230 [Synaphobranchus kaupii]